jgi:ferrochelatase
MSEYDHFVFSYHGLPERQITKIYPDYCKINDNCCSIISEKNKHCYRAACYYTTRELVKRLGISEGKYISSFQSRLDDKWLKPYSDKVVEQLAKEGKKKILVFSPAFVSDCLETIYEIGTEYEHIFKQHGGEKLQLVESLNENPKWIEAIKKMVL